MKILRKRFKSSLSKRPKRGSMSKRIARSAIKKHVRGRSKINVSRNARSKKRVLSVKKRSQSAVRKPLRSASKRQRSEKRSV